MLSMSVVKNSTPRITPPTSGKSSVKKKLRTERNHTLRKNHTHANAVMP